MTIIGDLWVSVRPETAGFNTDLKTKLESVVGGSGGPLNKAASNLGAGVVAGLAVAGVASVKLASDFQASVANIAANSNISTNAAKKIGDAFLSTAGTSIFSANQMAVAFGGVAGPLGLLQGHALDAKQSLDFMKISGDLAEASQTDLATATKTLQGIMTAFQIPVKDAAGASNLLFNTSRATGVGIDQLGSTIDKLKARLGVASPSLQDMGTLLVDLQEHGVQGSRGLMVVNTAINTLFKSASTVGPAVAKSVDSASKAADTASSSLAAAQTRLAAAQGKAGATGPTLAQTQALAKAQQAVAQATTNVAQSTGASSGPANALANAQLRLQQIQAKMAAGGTASVSQSASLTSAQNAVAKATAKHDAAVQALTLAQQGLSPTLKASVAGAEALGVHVFDAAGKFEGMGKIIGQLQPQLKGMNQQQQLNALSSIFGANANKALLATVLGGSAAWDKAAAAVTRKNGVEQAAAKQQQTLKHQMDLVKATLSDVAVKVGDVLIPKLEALGHIVAGVTQFLEKHKAIATALAVVLGTVLAGAVAVFTVNIGTKMAGGVMKALRSIGLFGGTVKAQKPAVASLEEVLTVLTATITRLADSLPVLDTQLGTTGAAFDGLTETVTVGEESMATTAEVAGPAIEAGLGPIGIVIGAIALLLPLLLTHWKTIWHAILEVAHIVVHAFEADFNFFKRIIGDVVSFFKTHIKQIGEALLVLTGPVGIGILIFVKFHKQIVAVFKDVIAWVKKVPSEILKAFSGAGHFLLKVGKDIVGGLIKGLEFISPLYWVVHFRKQIGHFFGDVGHWLLEAGKKLVEGLIKGAIEAPLDGLKKVGKGILHGIKSVFHIFSPSQDTQPLGKALTDGLVKGLSESAAERSQFAKALGPMHVALKGQLKAAAQSAKDGGMAIMIALAKGITDGTGLVTVAFGKIGQAIALKVGSGAGGGGAPAGAGGGHVAQQMLDLTKAGDIRLQSIAMATNTLVSLTAYSTALERTETLQQMTLTRATSDMLNAILQRDFAMMTTQLVQLGAGIRQVDLDLSERGNVETALMVQNLTVDRLALAESKGQTALLRAMLAQMQQPQSITLKPPPGQATPGNASGNQGASQFAAAVLT